MEQCVKGINLIVSIPTAEMHTIGAVHIRPINAPDAFVYKIILMHPHDDVICTVVTVATMNVVV